MITETSAVAFRQNLGEMLNIVQYRRDSVVITKDGKPVAALVDAALFERIRAMQDHFDALCGRIAKGFADVPVKVGLAEIERASALARQETVAEWRAAGRLPPLALPLAPARVLAHTPARAPASVPKRPRRSAGQKALPEAEPKAGRSKKAGRSNNGR